ncbi:2OG-Fe(II) oxygenase [Pseudomonas sp. CCM 7893]|uniref:2OG-Fe(II) oxygenase n=1 Tax=Pseudomonas spelaei TaxID=1055469 RepID=A0A6I3VXS4_9PSED|nr:2OG-Fe(II) oxygenase [Pseudomonas spelaei]MUF02755.1 2OG-Fe(II) oxygenase [Pseudomonas spelaei]QLG95040.1 2OG-Fe(II) oxygenase [Pseudomonas yamanorum]
MHTLDRAPRKNTPAPAIDSRILTLEKLSRHSLQQLIDGEVLAIRIPNYCDETIASALNQHIDSSTQLRPYTHEVYEEGQVVQHFYGVHRWGTPFNSTYGKASEDGARQKYYGDALHMQRLMEGLCAPRRTPIQTLIGEFNAHWPAGAAIAAFEGQPMYAGIIRAMFPETAHLSETTPHVDCLPQGIVPLEQQFSANIYLQTPPSGGELRIWDTEPFSFAEIEQFEGENLPQERLLEPLRMVPQKNELIIMNTRRPHAICGFESGKRISIQSFIGYVTGQPFQFWC